MCFSAPASLIASGGLAVAGIASVRLATRPEEKLIAVLPLVFAVQQAIEGWQWISLNAGSPSMLAGYLFVFFAFFFWPIYVPLVVFLNDKKRRAVAGAFVAAGAALALYFVSVLVRYQVLPHICGHSIAYTGAIPATYAVIFIYYVIISGSLIVSSKPAFKWFGAAVFLSMVFTMYFYLKTFTSVSCFFAAILSSLVYFYMRSQHHASKEANKTESQKFAH